MKKEGDIFPLKDPVKRSLFLPKLMLESVNFWPEKQRNIFVKITNWFLIIICICIESGQVAFVIKNINDFEKIASAISTVSTTFQAITKLSVLYFYSEDLKSVLRTIWYDFWPADYVGLKTEKRLKFYNMIIICAAVVMFLTAILFAFGFLSLPLRSGNRILPFESIYPFNSTKSPIYEIIYILQWMVNIAVIIVGICGHDYLFVGICSNIVAQFILLQNMFRKFGTKHEEENKLLLKQCINHHITLINVCNEVIMIFSFSAFIQLFSSVTALCVAALIVTLAEPDVTLFTTIISYLLGHLLQLFLFCTLGNEVTFHASNFPNAIFSSEWYNTANIRMKKDVLFVMMVAQKEVKFSALGIVPLDFPTFIAVLKLSFSFYTMLSKVT